MLRKYASKDGLKNMSWRIILYDIIIDDTVCPYATFLHALSIHISPVMTNTINTDSVVYNYHYYYILQYWDYMYVYIYRPFSKYNNYLSLFFSSLLHIKYFFKLLSSEVLSLTYRSRRSSCILIYRIDKFIFY